MTDAERTRKLATLHRDLTRNIVERIDKVYSDHLSITTPLTDEYGPIGVYTILSAHRAISEFYISELIKQAIEHETLDSATAQTYVELLANDLKRALK